MTFPQANSCGGYYKQINQQYISRLTARQNSYLPEVPKVRDWSVWSSGPTWPHAPMPNPDISWVELNLVCSVRPDSKLSPQQKSESPPITETIKFYADRFCEFWIGVAIYDICSRSILYEEKRRRNSRLARLFRPLNLLPQ